MPDQAAPDARMSPEAGGPGAPPENPPQKKPVWPWVLAGCGTLAVVTVTLLVVGFFKVVVPILNRGPQPARRAQCKSNLRQIGMGLHSYAEEYDEDFPESFQQLYPIYLDNAKIFSCPQHPSSWRDFQGGLVSPQSSSYVYLPGRFPALAGDFVLAFEEPENHQGQGFNVLYCDDHVEWWGVSFVPEFVKLLKEQEAKLPELRKAHEAGKAQPQPTGPPALPAPAVRLRPGG